MIQVRELLVQNLNESMIHAVVSNPRHKTEMKKIVFHPFREKEEILFQREEFRNNQVFHTNMGKETTIQQICSLLEKDYKQMDLQCEDKTCHVLVNKKGKSTIRIHKTQEIKRLELSHNRRKKYILDTGETIPFLVDLGVQTKDGNVVEKRYKKYRQINRFLEFIRDVLPELRRRQKAGQPLRIIDFGCGKSYLTFAVYYYLKVIQEMDVEMVGLDLKEDVIEHCNELAEKYGYSGLRFLKGDIRTYESDGKADMVITLHACDTATDYALYHAVCWGTGVILSVPCCQHELNRQMENEQLQPILKHGILKERFASLLTDALRAEILEQKGYDVQILEFIDMEHTPKNLLIRAVKRRKPVGDKDELAWKKVSYQQLCDAYRSHGTLERLFDEE